MLNWKYWALAVSSATTMMVGIALHTAGCGVSIADVEALKGPCDPAKSTCECQKDNDCPADFCTIATCVAGQCVKSTNAEHEGMALPTEEQVANDCKAIKCIDGAPTSEPDVGDKCDRGVCDSMGNCVDCNAAADCPQPAPMEGWRCAGNKCASCSNGIQDADETGIDWGGACPKKSTGAACADLAECDSGFCADGVCCNNACDMPCEACNPSGTCTPVTPGEPDDTCATADAGIEAEYCTPGKICDNKSPNGEPCGVSNQCASNNCKNNICVSP